MELLTKTAAKALRYRFAFNTCNRKNKLKHKTKFPIITKAKREKKTKEKNNHYANCDRSKTYAILKSLSKDLLAKKLTARFLKPGKLIDK